VLRELARLMLVAGRSLSQFLLITLVQFLLRTTQKEIWVFWWERYGRIGWHVGNGVPISPMLQELLVSLLMVHNQWLSLEVI
jgi:hypothetical protein